MWGVEESDVGCEQGGEEVRETGCSACVVWMLLLAGAIVHVMTHMCDDAWMRCCYARVGLPTVERIDLCLM